MPRLLASQSHVVYGYVGNKAATFPLQCLGWDVDCCNTVQYSNHTGYGLDRVFGDIASAEQLKTILKGLLLNFPTDYDCLLSGYLPTRESVECVGDFYRQFKQRNPRSLWLMDPVMGDEGKLYVSKDVVPAYIQFVKDPSCKIDIITPNQFELELLHGSKVDTLTQLQQALGSLHEMVPIIVVTSCNPSLFSHDSEYIYCVASTKNHDPIVFQIPLIRSYFTGVGDLFAALLIDKIYKLYEVGSPESSNWNKNFQNGINDVINIVQKVLELTKKYTPPGLVSKMGSPSDMKKMELRIIEARDIYTTSTDTGIDYSYRQPVDLHL